MKLDQDIKPVTYMKTHAADLVQQVRETGRPVVITQHGQASAVMMDVATYESFRDAALMLQLLSQSEHELTTGNTSSQSAAFIRARKRLAQRQRR